MSYRHHPFLADVVQRQVKQIQQRFIVWERSPILGNLAQAHVHRFNRIGGVGHFPDFRWVNEERDDAWPVALLGLNDGCEARPRTRSDSAQLLPAALTLAKCAF